MLADGRSAFHRDVSLPRHARRLDVEIVKHFDVVTYKADRSYHRRLSPEAAQDVAYVGLQPRVARAAAAALESQPPMLPSETLGNQPRRFAQLLDVGARRRHRSRNAVRGEDELRASASAGCEACKCVGHAIGGGFYEERMRVPFADVLDHGRRGTDPVARPFDVAQARVPARIA